MMEHTFFASASETFTKIVSMLGHNPSLNIFWRISWSHLDFTMESTSKSIIKGKLENPNCVEIKQ